MEHWSCTVKLTYQLTCNTYHQQCPLWNIKLFVHICYHCTTTLAFPIPLQCLPSLVKYCWGFPNGLLLQSFKWSSDIIQLNILNNFFFMHKIKSYKQQQPYFKPYFSTSNYSIPLFKLGKSKDRISGRGPALWKSVSKNSEKRQKNVTTFKNSLKK